MISQRHHNQVMRGRGSVKLRAAMAKVSAVLDLTASSQTVGEWSSIVDRLNSNPATSDAARRAAVGAASNGVSIATFATNDCWSWPLATGNNARDKRGFAFWVRQTTSGTQLLMAVHGGTGGANAQQTRLYLDNSTQRILFDHHINNSDGREAVSLNNAIPAAGTWFWLRTMYDSTQSTEATKVKAYVNGALLTWSQFSDIGAGGTLGTLPGCHGEHADRQRQQ